MNSSAKTENKLWMILPVAAAVLILAADVVSKYFVARDFTVGQTSVIIPYIFDFCFIYNTGGAWGMLSDKTWLLTLITAALMIGVIIWLILKKISNKILFTAVCLILSGGVGNMLDRIFRGKVVDFIQFAFWKGFPVFNIADCAVCIGAALLILYLLSDIIKEQKDKKEKQNANL